MSSSMGHAVACAAAPRRGWRSPPTLARHAPPSAVAVACTALRLTVLRAWRSAAHRPTEAETQAMRDLARTHDWRWPSMPRLVKALVDLQEPDVWDRIATWAMEQKAAQFPATRRTVGEAMDHENVLEATSDCHVRRADQATDVPTIESAIVAVRDQLAAGFAVLDALETKRATLVRPLGCHHYGDA